MNMNFFTRPKQFVLGSTALPKPAALAFSLTGSLTRALAAVGCDLSFAEKAFSVFHGTGVLTVTNEEDAALGTEEYDLCVKASSAHVRHKTPAGFYYALQTLAALAGEDNWREAQVHDIPAIALRGALVDIGRDKIPTMETLLRTIDIFAALRYNHLELYMEGYCYEYGRYRHIFPQETPITPQEFETLSAYATAHFIDLVPNQNCLGHMDQWLAKPQFRALAECPDGFLHQNLYTRPPMTLDVMDDGTLVLADYFFSQLLPRSQSGYVNVNLDEPFELGRGKNAALCEKEGVARLYLDFVLKIHALCAAYGKKMMMWGDVLFNHPEIMDQLPQDILLLDWIYEGDATFRAHCEVMQKAGRAFCLCPGTSSWATFAGRSDNMVKNIDDAVQNAVQYAAAGVILTDWGDLGHWQYLPVSQLAYVCGGQAMWTGEPVNVPDAEAFCNHVVFQDAAGKLFGVLYELGNYYQLEHAPLYNTTLCFALMSSKYPFDDRDGFGAAVDRLIKLCHNIAKENRITCTVQGIHPDVQAIEALLTKTLQRLAETQLCGETAPLLRAEVENTVAFIRHGLALYLLLSQEKADDYCDCMRRQFSDLDDILARHYKLWVARNRIGGFSRSTAHLQHLLRFYAREAQEV